MGEDTTTTSHHETLEDYEVPQQYRDQYYEYYCEEEEEETSITEEEETYYSLGRLSTIWEETSKDLNDSFAALSPYFGQSAGSRTRPKVHIVTPPNFAAKMLVPPLSSKHHLEPSPHEETDATAEDAPAWRG